MRVWKPAPTRGGNPGPRRPTSPGACGQPYRGINAIYLWLIAEAHGYDCPIWMTYNQASALGGQVRKGEKAEIAVFFKSYEKTDRDDTT
nr:ArdC family protein [Hyphomonas sp.]